MTDFWVFSIAAALGESSSLPFPDITEPSQEKRNKTCLVVKEVLEARVNFSGNVTVTLWPILDTLCDQYIEADTE